MGPGRHLVRYPLRRGRLINIVAVEERDAWAAEGWHHTDDPANLRRAFTDFCPEVRTLLDRVETVYLWGLFRHPVAPVWTDGQLALLGDAAHPTLPFLAQGANMALEDAWSLVAALTADPDSGDALRTYAELRRPRTARDRAGGGRQRHQLPPAPGSLAPRRPWRAAPRGPIRAPRRHRALRLAPWPRRHARRLTHRLGSPSSFRKYRSGEREGAKRPSPGSAPKATIQNDKVASAPEATIQKRIGAPGAAKSLSRSCRAAAG
jgi:2-polyprenyl-6-methoxyphenol hydroxylase-like FAD-dependent oxidoreductase